MRISSTRRPGRRERSLWLSGLVLAWSCLAGSQCTSVRSPSGVIDAKRHPGSSAVPLCAVPALVDTSDWIEGPIGKRPPRYSPGERDEGETWVDIHRSPRVPLYVDEDEWSPDDFRGFEACRTTVAGRTALIFAGHDPAGTPRLSLWFADAPDHAESPLYTVEFEPEDVVFAWTLLLCWVDAGCR